VRRRAAIPVEVDPVESARMAGLRYVSDEARGLRRVRSGKGFRYLDAEGRAVRDAAALARIRSLVIPPAWTNVWICPLAHGHLQATGRDARGRKQYRYHPRWRAVRDETKYHRMIPFARALPRIRGRVETDLRRAGLPREKVLATVVQLLETTLIRVGNEEYARANKSYGLTTLRNHHVEVDGARLRFEFRGKSGKHHTVEIGDRRLARIVGKMQSLPGHELFQYLDDDGERHAVGSEDVNQYLREITNDDFTAKDFRTWAGTVLAAHLLAGQKRSRKQLARALERVAQCLGNTQAVCRKCYVHPAVIDGYLDGTLEDALARKVAVKLHESEAAVLALLESSLRAAAAPRSELRWESSPRANRSRSRSRSAAGRGGRRV
jgi:DNA topoisomerase I